VCEGTQVGHVDDVAGLGGVDDEAQAEVHADVARGGNRPVSSRDEDEIPRLKQLVCRGGASVDLVAGGPPDRDAGVKPGFLGEAGAVECSGAGAAPEVGLAELASA